MKAKKGKINLTVIPNKYAPGACVSVGFKSKGDMCLGSVKNPDETAVLAAIKDQIYSKIKADAATALQHKISCLKCCTQGGEFIISAGCASSITSVRKVAMSIVKNLYPKGAVFYSNNMKKRYGVAGNGAAYKHAQNTIVKSIKDGLNVVITGKLRVDNSKVNQIADKVNTAFMKAKPPKTSAGSSRSLNLESHHDVIEMSVGSPLDAYLAKQYLAAKLGCCNVCINGNKVVVSSFLGNKVNTLANQSKINSFYKKLMKDPKKYHSAVLYYAAIGCCMSTSALESSANKSLSLTGMAGKLK